MKHADKVISVQPEWARSLPIQQQSVLLLACRGPDGFDKHHPCKTIHRFYRGSVLVAAKYGRQLLPGEPADSFMSMSLAHEDSIGREEWRTARKGFFDTIDALPHHYIMHLMYGAEILGYKHPLPHVRSMWRDFYIEIVDSMHLNVETEEQMDQRLSDWGREHWDIGHDDEPEAESTTKPCHQCGEQHSALGKYCDSCISSLTDDEPP